MGRAGRDGLRALRDRLEPTRPEEGAHGRRKRGATIKAARQGFHLTPYSLPRDHPCARREYRRSAQRALVDHISGPGVLRLGRAMIDSGLRASELEGVGAEEFSSFERIPDVWDRRASDARRRELDVVVGQDGVDLVKHGLEKGCQELGCGPRRGLLVQLDEGELRSAVDRDEEVELALLGSDLGDVDVEVADRVAPELLNLRLTGLSPSTSGNRLIP